MNEAVSVAARGSAAAQFDRLVHIGGLAKTFFSTDQHFTALDGVDLDLAPDDFFCLLGPSGCGKTTVLNILAGFEEPTDGTVEFEGARVAGPSRDRGVVFQADNSLYEWLTAAQNVEFGLRLSGASAAERARATGEFLELVGLADQGHKYPHELSGGMRQRVQLARVLANHPRMLVMDEPFAALDAQNRRVLQDELRRIWQEHKVTVLFITHDIEEALLLGTRIGVMTAGPNARIKEIIDIPPEMKRDRVDHGFVEMYARVQDLIADETNKSLAAQAGRAMEESKPLGRTSIVARERHRRARQSQGVQSLGIYAMSIVAFFVIWHFGSVLLDSVLFPSPVRFLVTFGELLLDGTLIHEAYVSLQRILSGFIIGSLIAIPLGLLMGSFRVMRLILDPYIELLRFIPSIAMITVAVIFFGLGEGLAHLPHRVGHGVHGHHQHGGGGGVDRAEQAAGGAVPRGFEAPALLPRDVAGDGPVHPGGGADRDGERVHDDCRGRDHRRPLGARDDAVAGAALHADRQHLRGADHAGDPRPHHRPAVPFLFAEIREALCTPYLTGCSWGARCARRAAMAASRS